jgi:hypothetical protein
VLTTVVPALLGFLAAALASVLGYRQWKRQDTYERSKTFIDDKSAAYKELWTRVERIDIRLRTVEKMRDEEFASDVRALNSYILASEIYFDPGLRQRVKTYLDAARHVSQIIGKYPAQQRQRAITETGPYSGEDLAELIQAVSEAENARETIRREVRMHLEGEG